ncbi:MAG: type II toxin-antitoxin system RelE/ParE family toxin [Actinobacteria bacterium]|nr:type II toxin-antitoxin system RelE/ParE family toxin [Actinomycetota bacterium]
MAEIIWTEPALADLDAIADYIALDNPEAARKLVRKVFRHVGQLADHPKSGSKPPELKGWRYRQIVEPPCRIFYREDGRRVFILYVMRGEMSLHPSVIDSRDQTRSDENNGP